MNDQITLDHPSCHAVKGWFRATGEWEASDDVLIHLVATGRGNGIGIDWDYEIGQVDLYEEDQQVATVYAEGANPLWVNKTASRSWLTGKPLSETSKFWMLGIAYCWAMKSAEDWANKNAEGIAE
jgi:hypothetical protein